MTWEEYREVVQEVRDKVRETKAELELSGLHRGFHVLQTKGKLGIMWVFSRWKWKIWLHWTKKRLRFSVTPMPQSSNALAMGKANAGTGRMKTLSPLQERIRFKIQESESVRKSMGPIESPEGDSR